MRNRITKNLRALLLTLALCCLPQLEAQAFETPDFLNSMVKPIEIGFDVVIIRPLGFATVIVGAALFVPAVALSLPNLSTTFDEALEIFITIPYENLFERPLGEF